MFFRALTAAYLFILTFLIAVQNSDSIWGNGETWVDASVYKYVAWMIDLGYMPYKDTFDHKGPLVYLIFLVGRRIASWRGVWVLYFVLLFVALSAFWMIFRKFCSRGISALLMLVISAASFDYAIENISPENIAIPFLAAALYIFIDYFLFDKISAFRLLVTGACFGCVLLIKAQMISVWFVFCIAVLIRNIREKTIPKIFNFLAFFLAGCMAVVVPVSLWLIRGGAWKDFLDDYFVFNMKYTRSYTGTTFFESMSAKARAMLFFFNKPLVLFCLFLCVALLCLDRSNRFFHASYLTYIILSAAVAAMAGRTYRHYGASLFVSLTWPLAAFAIRAAAAAAGGADADSTDGGFGCSEAAYAGASRSGPENPLYRSGVLLLGLAWLVCIYAAPVLFAKADKAIEYFQDYSSGNTALSSNLQGMLDIIAKNTTEEDKITVHGLYDILYGKSERLSASKYTFQHAFAAVDPERNDEYYAELEANPPKLIIQGDTDPERMMEFITSHGYHWIANSEEGDYKIYKRFEKTDDPQKEWVDTLRKTNSFPDYLELLRGIEEKQDIAVFVAVKGMPGEKLSVDNAAQLQALGFHDTDVLLDDGYHTFLGVSRKNRSLYEAIGGNGNDQYKGEIDSISVSLTSAAKKRGNEASVKIGGVEYALNQRGFNIVVYDPDTRVVLDSVAFDTEKTGIPCTR